LVLAVPIAAWVTSFTIPAFGQSEPPADLILTNGKILTVDDEFKIAQAIAIKGDRIIAVGTSERISRFGGPATVQVDLQQKTVLPGLIDNHAHYMYGASHWENEVRFDGITSRATAAELLHSRVKTLEPGKWLLVLGGWAEEQFLDSQVPFSREELDRISPNAPVMITRIFSKAFLNSAGLVALGLNESSADLPGGKLVRDQSGKLTGEIEGGIFALLNKLPSSTLAQHIGGVRAITRYLNSLGVTAYLDASWPGMSEPYFEAFRRLAQDRELSVRTFVLANNSPWKPEDVDAVLEKIRVLKPFQGDLWFETIGYGETVYRPLHDSLLAASADPKSEQLEQFRRIITEIAKQGMHLHVHVTLSRSIDAFLSEIEKVDSQRPVKPLRWTFAHLDQVNAAQLERMKKLGMYAAVHSRPSIQGLMMRKPHGAAASNMPPLRLLQDSGVRWGLGTDATMVAPVNPFLTLWWATTGKMVGGTKVTDQALSRAEALIAYTRSNAYLLFQESNLGSIQPGKLADIVVIDRDYLTVPIDEIKDIRPVMTIVGGKVVYRAQ
jgi:predicted amidohydrolase YtcJ